MEDHDYEWAMSWVVRVVKEEPESGKTTQSTSIFRVPEKMLDVRPSAFLPENFPFGCFSDHGRLNLNHKWLHFPSLFRGTFGDVRDITYEDIESPSPSRNTVRLDEAFKGMIHLVKKAVESYGGDSYLRHYEFQKMVEDGCFVVEMLRLQNKFMTNDEKKQLTACGGNSDSPIFDARWQLPSLQRDLIKLQNQIPLFFLEELFSRTTSGNDEPSLQHLFFTFLCSMFSLEKSIYKLDPNPKRNYAHALDLFRSSFIFSMRKQQEGNEVCKVFVDNPKLIYSAQDLQEAGVAFIRKEKSHLLDISFDLKKGVLQIPPLSIDENMVVALLNFVAYEQCDQSKEPYFTNYLLFLDSLINTIKDVEILRKNRIIRYPLGTEKEVVDLFNNFCKGMLYSFDQTYLSVDMNAVNSYCEAFYNSRWRFWWSNLRRERFSNPWTFLSLMAAIILLILTLLQTFFTIFPYYHPN